MDEPPVGQPLLLPYLYNRSGRQYVAYTTMFSPQGHMVVECAAVLKEEAFERWQQDAWNVLHDAARDRWYAEQEDIRGQITDLEAQLTAIDTLTLRREESEEIMKGVLRWLLGPSFTFMPQDVIDQFIAESSKTLFIPMPGVGSFEVSVPGATDVKHGAAAAGGDGLPVTAQSWLPVFRFEEMVKFINEAIEWENVLYFLYSYFWDIPASWRFIRQIRHPDPTRQAFLRAESARVVLTVRKGWEKAWVNFVETGGFGTTLTPDHPYLTIAQEIQNYDNKNYPGIPAANPNGQPLPEGDYVATTCKGIVGPAGSNVSIEVESSGEFVPGYSAIVDRYDSKENGSTIQEVQRIISVPDDRDIVVEGLKYRHDGSKRPFPVMQAGERGQLVAEWFEYTPSSGVDIAVSSNLEDAS